MIRLSQLCGWHLVLHLACMEKQASRTHQMYNIIRFISSVEVDIGVARRHWTQGFGRHSQTRSQSRCTYELQKNSQKASLIRLQLVGAPGACCFRYSTECLASRI